MDEEENRRIRATTFSHLDNLVRIHGENISWVRSQDGFPYGHRIVRVLGPQKFFTPAGMQAPRSITTAPESLGSLGVRGRGRPGRLPPLPVPGTESKHRDNVSLRRAWGDAPPLISLHGVAVGRYGEQWPVFVHEDDPASLTFTVALEDPQLLRLDLSTDVFETPAASA